MTKPVDLSVDGFSRYRIDFGYDGTDFAGFAKQPGLRTVQSELVKGLEVIFGKDNNDFGLRVAGRTDAGVHAQHQVVHVDLSPAQLKRIGRNPDIAGRVNTALPQDIRLLVLKRLRLVLMPGTRRAFVATGTASPTTLAFWIRLRFAMF